MSYWNSWESLKGTRHVQEKSRHVQESISTTVAIEIYRAYCSQELGWSASETQLCGIFIKFLLSKALLKIKPFARITCLVIIEISHQSTRTPWSQCQKNVIFHVSQQVHRISYHMKKKKRGEFISLCKNENRSSRMIQLSMSTSFCCKLKSCLPFQTYRTKLNVA